MAKLFQASATMSEAMLLDALREGRLFIQQEYRGSAAADETRAEVMNIVDRIGAYAPAETVVHSTWDALLADDDRLRRFRLTQKAHAGEINCYRIAACVRYMWEIGLYDMQLCKSANMGFRHLCSLLFPDSNYDLYRRNCSSYISYEDECIIRKTASI